jgi:hypothetical protein
VVDQIAPRTRREQVGAAPRPTLLGAASDEIAEAVRHVRETPDTWKVYEKVWTRQGVYAAAPPAQAAFDVKFAGRVEDDDWRIVPVPWGPHAADRMVEVRLWTTVSEWKTRDLAEEWAVAQAASDRQFRIVARSSREETLLREYGVKKLVRE